MPFRKTRRNRQKAGSGQIGIEHEIMSSVDVHQLLELSDSIATDIARMNMVLGLIEARINTLQNPPTPSAPLPPPSPLQPLYGDHDMAAAYNAVSPEEVNIQQQLMDANEAQRMANDAALAAALATDDNQSFDASPIRSIDALSDSLLAADMAMRDVPSPPPPPSYSAMRAVDLVDAAGRAERGDTINNAFMYEPEYEVDMNRNRLIYARMGGRRRKTTRRNRKKLKGRNRRRTQSK